jgi:hypothetical protein
MLFELSNAQAPQRLWNPTPAIYAGNRPAIIAGLRLFW